CSFLREVISVFVKRYNCSAKIASACSSLKLYSLIIFSLALLLFFDERIVLISSSKIDIALIKPSTIFERTLAFFKSNSVLRVITSFYLLIIHINIAFKFIYFVYYL